MKLVGKRVERLNQFGDDLKISLRDNGKMKLSPALISRLQLGPSANKIGFGYPTETEETVVIYKAVDGNGVAVNRQGIIINIPHNRDLRSYLSLPNTGETEVIVTEEFETLDTYPGLKFHKVITVNQETINPEINNEQRAQNTIDDLHQAVEKAGGEVINKDLPKEVIEDVDNLIEENKENKENENKSESKDEDWF